MAAAMTPRRPSLLRRATMMTQGAAAALAASAEPAFHVPAFLQSANATSAAIPDGVSAEGYRDGMPVAYEPEVRKQANASPDAATRTLRRSTLPEGAALLGVVQPPPLLHSSLTPSCDRCSADSTDVRPSQVYCQL